MYLEVNGKKHEIIIIRKNNKNTYIRIKDDFKIYITTNRWIREKEINKLVIDNYDSIKEMIDKKIKKEETIINNMILGKKTNIIKLSTQKTPELYGNKFYVKDLDNLDKYLKTYALEVFSDRLKKIYDMFDENIPYPKLKIRKMSTRWGVCNRRDISVTLNFELIRKDIKYLDYVIVHELSHLVYFNHSKDFWNLVSKYNKNYKEIRKEMRE